MMTNGDIIKKAWIITENCSTDIVTNSLDYVEEVRNFTKYEDLTLLTNGGLLLFDRRGCLHFYF